MERAVVPAYSYSLPLAAGRSAARRSPAACRPPLARRPAARYGVAEGLGVGDKSAVTLTLDRALCRCAAVLAVGVGGGK